MRTKEEMVKRWRSRWLALGMDALAGLRNFPRERDRSHADIVMDLPAEIDKLIAQMYDDLEPKPPEPKPVPNGVPAKDNRPIPLAPAKVKP